MKKIINGKRYDTESARLIVEWSNNLSDSDFRCCEEDLYCTKNGNYFLAGCGGALSKYCTVLANRNRCWGSDIIPVTPDEAMKWLEEKNEAYIIENEFSDSIEDA